MFLLPCGVINADYLNFGESKSSPSLLEKPGDHQGSPGFGLADLREQFFRTIEEEVGFAILVLLEDCPGGDPHIIHSLGSGDVKIVSRVIFGNG